LVKISLFYVQITQSGTIITRGYKWKFKIWGAGRK